MKNKNIWILPTDKPSPLMIEDGKLFYSKNFGFNEFNETKNFRHINKQNIYITSNEEIKNGDSIFETDTNTINIAGKNYVENQNDFKIILTTDQDLIKDGVQSIDDEFLEWFVKNPSCEFVEVEESILLNTSRTYLEVDKYKIIIPKEEPKQELSTRLENSLTQFNLTLEEALNIQPSRLKQIGFGNRSIIELQSFKEEPKQNKPNIEGESFEIVLNKDWFPKQETTGIEFYKSADMVIEIKKQETLEEVASNLAIKSVKEYMRTFPSCDNTFDYRKGFEEGFIEFSKWQAERISKLRDELYNQLPTGKINAFDLIKIINDHIEKLDEL